MNVAIIPARGGSKRIPCKNIKPFYGKPMIAWSIEAALKAKVFDHVIVSTNNEGIAQVAKEWGAEIPFMRPKELSDDYTGTTEVVAHSIKMMKDYNWNINAVCCIYATAPFIMFSDIVAGLSALNCGDWDYVFSITDFAAPIFRSFEVTKEGGVKMFFPEYFTARSQDLPESFHDAGQFYWGKPKSWLEGKRIFDRHSKPIFIPRWRVQDIDTQEDWNRAQILAPVILSTNSEL
ncbi:MAG: pseudaminic acid cytidylyltransferase [Coxiellaceae bacterium]|jgi:N-acylneuraminate cytidylyltransferase|nr:pseudaminic acid cytidylyltransferase [Coxiellaceae bacterium]